jgi:hypothetical protein
MRYRARYPYEKVTASATLAKGSYSTVWRQWADLGAEEGSHHDQWHLLDLLKHVEWPRTVCINIQYWLLICGGNIRNLVVGYTTIWNAV